MSGNVQSARKVEWVPESGHEVEVPVGGWSQSSSQCCDTDRTADCPTLEPAAEKMTQTQKIRPR